MERLTEYHSGVAVIKNKNMLSEAMKKLAAYEDAEEQGRLLRLPFALGQDIYWITTECDANLEAEDACNRYDCKECPHNDALTVVKGTVRTYHIVGFLEGNLEREYFLTREEAEQTLKKMEE